MRIFIVGAMASGKSSIGVKLAKSLHLDFFDTDHMIEKKTGVNISWIFEKEGEKGFRSREELAMEEISKKDNFVIATGGGSILSKKNRSIIKKGDHVIYLMVSIKTQLKRTMYNKSRPLINVDDKEKTLRAIAKDRAKFYEKIATIKINPNDRNLSYTVDKITKQING